MVLQAVVLGRTASRSAREILESLIFFRSWVRKTHETKRRTAKFPELKQRTGKSPQRRKD
jgi:hypothetical protein